MKGGGCLLKGSRLTPQKTRGKQTEYQPNREQTPVVEMYCRPFCREPGDALRYGILFNNLCSSLYGRKVLGRTMNTTATEHKQGKQRMRRLVKTRAQAAIILEEEGIQGIDQLLIWQAWQMHAVLRKRLLPTDPGAVRMIDELVRDLTMLRLMQQNPEEMGFERIIEQLSSAQGSMGAPLAEEECYAIMATPAQWVVMAGQ
jgi:hypothetical protein